MRKRERRPSPGWEIASTLQHLQHRMCGTSQGRMLQLLPAMQTRKYLTPFSSPLISASGQAHTDSEGSATSLSSCDYEAFTWRAMKAFTISRA